MREPRSSGPAPTRRELFRRTGGALAASAVAGAAVPLVHAREPGPIKLALVGCGSRGTGAVSDAFASTGGPVVLHAMADLFADRLEASYSTLASEHPGQVDVPADRKFLGFDAYRHAIDSLGPGDVVLLTTHAAFRPMMFEYAVAKGVNVFMEKSFATDAPNTRRLLAAAEESERKGLKVGVGFMWRHSKARQEVIARIHDGAIGDVHTLRIYRVHGPTHCPPLPAGSNEVEFQIRHAFSFNWTCSGFLVDWHCHNIDVACWAKGAWPIAAQAMAGRTHAAAGNLLDHHAVEFVFPDGARLFSFSRHMDGTWADYSDHAAGTKGSAILMTNLATAGTRIHRGWNPTPEFLDWSFEGEEPNPYHVEWQELLDSIRNDTPHNESRRAVEANFAGLLGRAAAHTGQYVTMDEVKASNFQFVADIDAMTLDTPPPIRANPDGLYDAPVPGVTVEL